MSKVELQNIAFGYGRHTVLEDFSCTFAPGLVTCLLGPSGCGKTTILRLIAGLEVPQRGTVSIGESIVSQSGSLPIPPHKRKVGFIFQDLALWPHLTIYENIAFGLKEQKSSNITQKVSDILDRFGIRGQQKKYPHQLSGGQKQMVAIARSLVLHPDVLLMDEPLANIDVQVKNKILEHLLSLQKQYAFAVIYVTHDHREAFNVGQSIVVMKDGKIIEKGTSDEIKRSTAAAAADSFLKSFIKT